MKLTEQEKQKVHSLYLAWVDEISDDFEDKTYFSVDEIVTKVIEIVENVYGGRNEHA